MAGEPYDTDRVWTRPNALSMLRLAGVPVLLWLILAGHDAWAVGVLALGGLTDFLDGYLARALHQTSRLGQLLDPVADRLYILTILVGLAVRTIIPRWLVLLLVFRDVALGLLMGPLRSRGFASLPVHAIGKGATFLLLYAFPLVLLGADEGFWPTVARVAGWAGLGWGTLLAWWAVGLYARQTLDVVRRFPEVAGR